MPGIRLLHSQVTSGTTGAAVGRWLRYSPFLGPGTQEQRPGRLACSGAAICRGHGAPVRIASAHPLKTRHERDRQAPELQPRAASVCGTWSHSLWCMDLPSVEPPARARGAFLIQVLRLRARGAALDYFLLMSTHSNPSRLQDMRPCFFTQTHVLPGVAACLAKPGKSSCKV